MTGGQLRLSTQTSVIKFWIAGLVVPKARPRFSGGRVLLPKNYRGWKNAAYLEILSQLPEFSIIDLPIKKAEVEIKLVGKHRGDGDNILGSYLDVLVEAGIIQDDRLSCVPSVSLKSMAGTPLGAEIVITPLD